MSRWIGFMNRHEALTLTTVCVLGIVVAMAIMPSRSGLPISTVNLYLTMTSLGTASVTVTETRTSTTASMITVGYTAAYALLGPPVGPLSGFLPPNQTGCMYLYGTDHNTYSLYSLPPNYPTGDVSVYGQYLTWEPFPQDSCSGIRIYVTSISQ